MASSMIYMSLEKRLRMRPRGVVSKKDMGERRMLPSMLSWRLMEARMLAKAEIREAKKMNIPCPNPSTPYTPRNSPTELQETTAHNTVY